MKHFFAGLLLIALATISGCKEEDESTFAVATTVFVSDITFTSAKVESTVHDDGGDEITSRGVVFGTTTAPVVGANTSTSDGAGLGDFSSNLTSLAPGTSYFVRAYVTNAMGTVYGNELTFKTTPASMATPSKGLPTVTGSAKAYISHTSMSFNAQVNGNGGDQIVERGFVWSTDYNATIALPTKVIVTGDPNTGVYTGTITGMAPNTTYYVRAYATNRITTGYSTEIVVRTPAIGPTVKDFDGNEYNMVFIGLQYWTASNLKTAHYNDGSEISTGFANADWQALSTGGYSVYNDGAYPYEIDNNATYGKLYNYFVVKDPRGVCPTGTHVPTESEWNKLTNTVSGSDLQEVGHVHWKGNYGDGNNSTGFTALPGGERSANGSFINMGVTARWWSASEFRLTSGYSCLLWGTRTGPDAAIKSTGLSIRCIAD